MDGTSSGTRGIRALMAGAAFCALALPAGALGAVTGNVFRDYDQDGVRDAREPGQAGLTVTAFGPSGQQIAQTTTNGAGDYALAVADTTKVRVEVSGLPTAFAPGPRGGGSAGLVQFVTAPASGLVASVASVNDYCQQVPVLATSCLTFGPSSAQTYANPSFAAIKWLPDDAPDGGAVPTAGRTLATQGQVGAVWGMAWHPTGGGSGDLYAASFVKRHAGLGPNRNPGTIYRIPMAGTAPQAPSVFVTLPAGIDPHPADAAGFTAWMRDSGTWDAVGKTGLGDIDISADGETIYAVNLADRRLYRIPRQNPAAMSSIAIPQPAGCGTDDWRPFGIGVEEGRVYAGVVCTNQSTQTTGAGFAAYVYRTDPTVGTFGASPVLTIPLSGSAYPRKCNGTVNTSAADNLNAPCSGDGVADWRPWLSTTPPTGFYAPYPRRSQPWLADIVFDNGAMILGLRDRFGDQTGNGTYAPGGISTTLYYGVAQGDQLRACATGPGTWQIEQNGSCGGVSGGGVGNGEGPGGGEFYNGDDNYFHDHISVGGLAQIPGRADVAGTVIDPFPGQSQVFDGGVLWSSNTTGARVRSHQVHPTDASLFGKANGLGDLEALCVAAPIQIGDRVFDDRDADGLQDPGELGIAGVAVALRDAQGRTIGQTTTDVSGAYLFGGLTDQNLAAGQAIAPQSAYTLVFTAPAGTVASPQNAGSDGIDSDPSATGTVQITTGRAGANDHTIDAGYVRVYSLGNRVFDDRDGNGEQNGAEPGIPGVALRLLTGAGAPLAGAQTTTDAEGRYRFDGLLPGDYIVEVAASNFTGVLAGRSNTTGTSQEVDPDTDGDRNDNGWDAPAAGAIRTLPVTLGPGASEPQGETDLAASGQGAPDAYANMTVDLGFVALAEIGDRVWLDDNGNGLQDEASARGVNGVTVQLLDGAGHFIRQTTTTSDATGPGWYSFPGLAPGTYAVRVLTATLPAGYQITLRDAGASDAADSDADPATGQTATIALSTGQRVPTLDFGAWRPQGSFRIIKEVQDPLNGAWLDADADPGTLGSNDPTPAILLAGERATYRIRVISTGTVPLAGIVVRDPDCGLAETIALLGVGETRILTCTRPSVAADNVNTATASGARVSVGGIPQGPELAPESERASVRVLTPSYTLLKEVQHPTTGAWLDADAVAGSPGSNDGIPAELLVGETARYRISVTNTGQVNLRGVRVRDEWCGLERTIDVPVGQTIPLTCERPNATANHVNTATAEGATPVMPDGRTTTATGATFTALPPRTEPATVTVHAPAYTLLKEVLDPRTGAWLDADAVAGTPGANDGIVPVLAPGTSASYRITVTNTGTTTLTGISVQDPMCNLVGEVMKLPAGERAVFECQRVVTGSGVNTAVSSGGTPSAPHGRVGPPLASRTETAAVRVPTGQVQGAEVRSRLGLTKTGPGKARPGALVAYTITVRVPRGAAAPARRVVVRDFLPEGLVVASPANLRKAGGEIFRGRVVWRVGTLAPGTKRTLSVLLRVSKTTTGTVRNRARVSSDNAQPMTAFAETTVRASTRRAEVKVTG